MSEKYFLNIYISFTFYNYCIILLLSLTTHSSNTLETAFKCHIYCNLKIKCCCLLTVLKFSQTNPHPTPPYVTGLTTRSVLVFPFLGSYFICTHIILQGYQYAVSSNVNQ